MAYAYHHLHGIDVTVLRFFSVYGPAGRPDMSIFRFVKSIADDEVVEVYGDGSQRRGFCYVYDIAAGVLAALRPLGYDTINLGDDRPTALNEVIRLLEEVLGKRACVEYQPPDSANVAATHTDISRAQEVLGWSPQVMIEEGLRRTADWYLANREWASGLDVPRR